MDSLRNDRSPWLRRGSNAFIVSLALLSVGCSKSGPAAVEELTEVSMDEAFASTVDDDIQFGSALDENGIEEALLLDVHYPTNGNQTSRPAIIWLHGGSFQAGHKGEMTEFARRFARRGYVSVSANYRLRENAVFDYTDPDDAVADVVKQDAQHDIQAAVRWLRTTAGTDLLVDPARIYVAGYSAGGTTGLRVAAWPNDPGSSGNPAPSSSVAAVAAISAYLDPNMLEAVTAPTLLIHGQADTKVLITQIQNACTASSQCQLVPVPDAPHNMLSAEKENIIGEISRFFHALASTS